MKPIQVELDDAVHARLTALAKAHGVDREDERKNSLKAIAGLWKERKNLPDTRAYVRRPRRNMKSKRLRSN